MAATVACCGKNPIIDAANRPEAAMKTLLTAIALLPLLAAAHAAHAQTPGQAPPPGQFSAQPPPPGDPPPCLKEFIALRDVVEKRGMAIQAAAKRKAQAKEVCGLFNSYVTAEAKVVNFAEKNNVWCGIPPQALEQMKAQHGQALQTRTNICKVAAQGPRPAGPTLGDALGVTPIPNANNTKRGSGTFDTLTGSPLVR